jgi:ABC-2 type transport system permease protein
MVAPEQAVPAPPISSDGAGPGRYGEIFDRGYKHYDGPRLGRRHAIWALIFYSIKRAMGIKKSWTAKIMPILLYTSVAVPVAVGIGIQAFVADAEVFDYVAFYDVIFVIQGIFVAMITPEMVCGDRRENVLPLYFSRAITRTDYVLAKLCATALLTLTISLVPVLIYWLGVQLLDDSPLRAMADHRRDLGAILATGTLMALYLGSIGLAVSTFTGRKSIAVAVTVVGFSISTALAVALFNALDGEAQRYAIFLAPLQTSEALAIELFGSDSTTEPALTANFSAGVYAAVMLAVTAVATTIMYVRYRPNE